MSKTTRSEPAAPAVGAPVERHLTCCGSVWPAGAMMGQRCGLKAKYEHNLKHYCKTHHPPNVQAKRDARQTRYETEYAELRSASDAAQSAAEALRKNAERYLKVRRGQHWSVIDGAGDTLRGEALDAAVDEKPAVGAA